nr:lipocalin family protein [uncultured Chryseobacterium sp.]
MKKLFLSFAVFSAIASCSSDNNEEHRAPIEGTWKVSKAEIDVPSTGKITTIIPTGCEVENTLEFNGVHQLAINYKLKNDVCVPTTYTVKYNYDKPSKVLYYNEDTGQYSYKVTKLTREEMIIENDQYGFDDQGNTKVLRRYYKKIK